MTDEPRLVWPPALRKKVRPRWVAGGAAPVVVDVPARFEKLRSAYLEWAVGWERGIAHADADCATLMTEVRDVFAPGSAPPTAMSVEVAAAMAMSTWARYDEEDQFVPLCTALFGLSFAVEAAMRARMFSTELKENAGDYKARARRLIRKVPTELDSWAAHKLESLRRAVAHADDASHQAARDRASQLRHELPLPLRCAIAFAFASEPQWAKQDAATVLENVDPKKALPLHGQILHASLADVETIEALISAASAHWFAWDYSLDFVASLGVVATIPLKRLVDEGVRESRMVGRERLKGCARALAIIQSDEVADALAPHLAHEDLRGVVAEYFLGSPRLARRALEGIASSRSKIAGVAAQLLTTSEIMHGLRSVDTEPNEATNAELPEILVRPPWRAKNVLRRAPVVIEGVVPFSSSESMRWAEGEQQRLLEPNKYWTTHETMNAEKEQEFLASVARAKAEGKTEVMPFGQVMVHAEKKLISVREEVRLELWNTGPLEVFHRYSLAPFAVLARHGMNALPGVLRYADLEVQQGFEVLERITSPRIALRVARMLLRRAYRDRAQRWLVDRPEISAIGLVPPAVGPPGHDRDVAEKALCFLDRRGHGALVREVARRYGERATSAIDEILTRDPMLACPTTQPKLPPAWRPDAWPRPRLIGGRSLPREAVEILGEMLKMSPLEPEYIGIVQVRDACEAQSLHAFGWAMFTAWYLAGVPSQCEWMMEALAHLGDDEIVRRISPYVREWRLRGERKRALRGVDVLSAIGARGSEVAMVHLGLIMHGSRYADLRARARLRLLELAEMRGLSPDELADRIVPNLDLDPDGSKVLDLGPRSFRIGFDEHLAPFVEDRSGKRLLALPRVGKSDDAALSQRAQSIWKRVRDDAKAIAAGEIHRMELAMCTRRRWRVADFERWILGHPLVVHLARRLLWGTYVEGRLRDSFRVAEDGTLADEHDERFLLRDDEGVQVGLVHALDLSPSLTTAWGVILGDYEIVQPFRQLGREVFVIGAERDSNAIDALKGAAVHAGKMLALEYRGWGREQGVHISSFRKALPGNHAAHMNITPGFDPRTLETAKPQTIRIVWLDKGEPAVRPNWSSLDEVTFSEVMRDIDSVRT